VNVLPDHLHPGPVRRRAAALVAAAPEDLNPGKTRVRGDLLRDARLADAGLAAEQDQAPAPCQRLHDVGAQLFRLLRPPDENAPRQTADRIVAAFARRNRPARHTRDRAERPADDRGVGGAVGGRLGEEFQDEGFEIAGDLRVVPRGRDRRGVHVLRDHDDGVVADKRRAPGHHLVQHRAEGVEVAARFRVPPERLLRRHVRKRPHDRVLAGQARAFAAQRQPEISEVGDPVLAQPDVVGLDVAVDDAATMSVFQRVAHLLRDLQRTDERQAVCLLSLE
jgi:hypothetical protein